MRHPAEREVKKFMSKKLGEPLALARAEDGRTVIGPGAFAIMTDFAWLERANRNARKGKRYREEVRCFHQNLDGNLLDIQEDMRQGTYRTGGYRHLWVQVPKRRLVMALPYRDRIVQWSVYQLLNPYFDRTFIADSYACRVGKGSHKAVERLQYWLRKINRSQYPDWYYLKLDISKYFYRVDHEVLLKILRWRITDPDLMQLIERVVNNPKEPFGLPRGKKPEDVRFESWLYNVGMPIGNLLSQMFANIMLNELDQYCKHVLHIGAYIRYMDDILILGPDKEQLKEYHKKIAEFLCNVLHLDLNDKTCIRPVSMGIEFVGQRVWATHCILRKSTARRLKREVRKISENVRDKIITRQEFERRVASIRGMIDHTNSGALRWRLNEITFNIVGDVYGELPYGRGDSDRKAVRGCGNAKRNYKSAA